MTTLTTITYDSYSERKCKWYSNDQNEGTDHDGDIRLVIMVPLVMTMIKPVDIITVITYTQWWWWLCRNEWYDDDRHDNKDRHWEFAMGCNSCAASFINPKTQRSRCMLQWVDWSCSPTKGRKTPQGLTLMAIITLLIVISWRCFLC